MALTFTNIQPQNNYVLTVFALKKNLFVRAHSLKPYIQEKIILTLKQCGNMKKISFLIPCKWMQLFLKIKTLFFIRLCLNNTRNNIHARVNKHFLKITYLQSFSFKLISKKSFVTNRCNCF